MQENKKIKERISARFIDLVEQLKGDGAFKTYREFCAEIGILPQNFNEIKKGNRSVTVDMLFRFSVLYGAKLNYLFFGQQPPFEPKPSPTSLAISLIEEASISYNPSSYDVKEQLQKVETRFYPVEGNAMAPQFNNGDWAVGSLLLDYNALRDHEIYAVITRYNEIYVRQILLEKEEQHIQLIPNNKQSPVIRLPLAQIAEISKIRYRLTSQLDQTESSLDWNTMAVNLKNWLDRNQEGEN